MKLRLDDCSHCACVTHLHGYRSEQEVIDALVRGELGCDNCMEDDDGHHACVALFDEFDKVLWDGRHA